MAANVIFKTMSDVTWETRLSRSLDVITSESTCHIVLLRLRTALVPVHFEIKIDQEGIFTP